MKLFRHTAGIAIASILLLGGCTEDEDATRPNNENNENSVNNVTCTPETLRCDDTASSVEVCNADGTAWEAGEDCGDGTCVDGACALAFQVSALTVTPNKIVEGETESIVISASYTAQPDSVTTTQVRGPRGMGMGAGSGVGDGTGDSPHETTHDVSNLKVAADSEVVFEVTATLGDEVITSTVVVPVVASDMEPTLGDRLQIGGGSIAVATFDHNGTEWALFNKGNHLEAIPADASSPDTSRISASAFIVGIEIVTIESTRYALLALGSDGIAVVDVTDPMNMQIVTDGVGVNFYHPLIRFAEGGGSIVEEELVGLHGNIRDLFTDGTTLWIANASYGVHRTALSNLISETGPTVEEDGTLVIEQEAFTLQYAGENPWGGPRSMKMHNGRLFVAQGFLGLGIYEPQTLEKVGYYNLYTDASVVEDWFVDQDVSTLVHSDNGDLYLDAETGMPDYRQASYEVLEVWKGEMSTEPTPWAEFDRYGKFYYDARSVDIADNGGQSIAYIAYGLAGMVAVDVTGYETSDSDANFVDGSYLGYAPAIPAHGPEKPTGQQSRSLYPYFGAGMLKEAGVVDVKVSGTHVYYTDHFAGLVVIDGADDPAANWHGPDETYNNDDPDLADGVLGDHWPDYEFVTSYDMSPADPDDHDALSTFIYESPFLLVTGEITGHGNNFVFLPGRDLGQGGGTDIIYTEGAGGVSFTDIIDLNQSDLANRFGIIRHFPTTDEVGAAPDGTATAEISLGHTQGVEVTDNYLYVADGPHGVTVWRVTDDEGLMLDDIHVVANTIQSEDPIEVDGETIYPAQHAWGIHHDRERNVAWSMSQSLGVRRIDVSGAESGQGTVGNPLLLKIDATDVFEHNGDFGVVPNTKGQDHSYDIAFRGDLAYVADGSNGLTIYDMTKDPTNLTSGFYVSNIGGDKQQKPPLGRTHGIALYENEETGSVYAFMASGQRGIGVVDVTDVNNLSIVKVFEPIKIEDGKVGHADGRSVDVHVIGDHVYYSYTGFGVIVYTIADLLEPVPDGVDPTEIFKTGSSGNLAYDYRPETVSEFRLKEQVGYEGTSGEALYMQYTNTAERLVFHVAYGSDGVVQIDFTDPANPILLGVANTVGECTDIAILNGRLFAADGAGGLVQFK